MQLQMRKAMMEDIDEIAELYDNLNDHLEAHVNYPGWKKGMYPTKTEALHFFKTNTLYKAILGDIIVGSIALTHDPEKEPDNGNWLIHAEYDEIFVIHVLVVHPDFLRQGVGRTMLNFAEKLAKQQKVRSIRLDVYENNIAAINVYEKMGYSFIDKVDLGLGEYGLDWFCLYEKVV